MRVLFVAVFTVLVFAGAFLARPARHEERSLKDSAEVLETVPSAAADPVEARRRTLQALLRTMPDDVETATTLARLEIDVARRTGDPRYLSYAQAALKAWWEQPAPPAQVRMLRATLLQSSHRFSEALTDLDALLAADPGDIQARLTRATVLSVKGDSAAATRDCEALRPLTDAVVSDVCAAQVMSNAGQSRVAYETLRASVAAGRAPRELRGWTESVLGELAARAGRPEDATAHFRAALLADPTDRYTRAVFADLLLSLGKNDAAIELTRGYENDDALLLRAALAGQKQSAEQLRLRQAAARARGDRVHLREEARFALSVERQPEAALALAVENWSVQREHADAVLLLEAAVAAKKAQPVVKALVEELQGRHVTDPVLVALAASARELSP